MTSQEIADFRKEIFARIVKGLRALESMERIPTAELAGLTMMCQVHQSALFEMHATDLEIDDDALLTAIEEAQQHLRGALTGTVPYEDNVTAALDILNAAVAKEAMG